MGNRDGIKQSRQRLIQYKNNPKPHAAMSCVCTQLWWLRWKSAVRTACGGLSPHVHLTGRVSVGVQLVVGTSAQHQLVTETGKRRRVIRRFYVRNENVSCFFPSGYVIIITENTLTPLSVQSTLKTLSSWAARSYRGALQLWHTKKESLHQDWDKEKG